MFNYYFHFLQSGDNSAVINDGIFYLLPSLAALMKYRNIVSIGYGAAHTFFFDEALYPVLHTDILQKYRCCISKTDLDEVYQRLVDAGLLIFSDNLYSFSSDFLLEFANALHSFNLYDIEIKENIFISSSYPYDAHTDYFWQFLSTDILLQYEKLLPKGSSLPDHFGAVRLYVSWACTVFYGNGSDEKGYVDNSLKDEEATQYHIMVLKRALSLLQPVIGKRVLPGPAWNYAYFSKRIAELLLSMDHADNLLTAKQYLSDAFSVIHSALQILEAEGDSYPDHAFACKHLYDKYAQFLLQRCYPVMKADDEIWHIDGHPDVLFTEEEIEKEIIRALNISSSYGNPISLNRLGLLSLGIIPEKKMHALMQPGTSWILSSSGAASDSKNIQNAYHLFLKSADVGDFFARGMVAEIILDHSSQIKKEMLPLESAPDNVINRPRTIGEAIDRGLLADCCIAYITAPMDKDAWDSILSDSRKSRYATAFHQLGRCYLEKEDTNKAIRFLEAALTCDWSQNDNFGEYERLCSDLLHCRQL